MTTESKWAYGITVVGIVAGLAAGLVRDDEILGLAVASAVLCGGSIAFLIWNPKPRR